MLVSANEMAKLLRQRDNRFVNKVANILRKTLNRVGSTPLMHSAMPYFEKPAQLIGLHLCEITQKVFIVASLSQNLNLVHTVICAQEDIPLALSECHKLFKQTQKVYPSNCFVFYDFPMAAALAD